MKSFFERVMMMVAIKWKNGIIGIVIFIAFLMMFCFTDNAFGAVEYKLIVNCGENSDTYTISTANGRDNDGFPLIPLRALKDSSNADLGWYNTGYGNVLVWGSQNNPVVMLVDYSRIYITDQNGNYVPQMWVGTATTKNGVSYIPMKLTPYLGFEKRVDTTNKTITLSMPSTCTPVSAYEVYTAAKPVFMSYLNPKVVWLGSATTYYNSGLRDRTTNVTLAAKAINNVVLKAGQEFSFNEVVGRRTTAKGYKKAIIFSGGSQVMGIGGGVCQVSTTVYQAAKKSGMKITERHSHSQKVSYAQIGNDATVVYGSKDFRFINNTGGNIYIKTSVSGGVLSISFFTGTLPTGTAKYVQ